MNFPAPAATTSQNYLDIKLQALLKFHDDAQQLETPQTERLPTPTQKPKHSSTHTLPFSIGDNYLYLHNPVFKSIRDQTLKLGYKFTTEDFCHYHVYPYASLPEILRQKKIPYSDNVTVLRQIEKMHPARFTCAELIKVKPNYPLHEAAHAIAEHFLAAEHFLTGPNLAAEHLNTRTLSKSTTKTHFLSNIKISTDSKKAFRLIMAESFANAIESFANVYNTTAQQKVFYELNSYVTLNKKINSSLQQCIDLLGPITTFKLMYVSYLFANCLLPEPSHKQFQKILQVFISDASLLKKATEAAAIKKIFNHAFELSLDFRVQTTGFFFAYSGINTSLVQLLKIDILEILLNTSCVQDFLNAIDFLIKPRANNKH